MLIFTNNKICNVWPQATTKINWNVCLNIWGNKEMYQRKIKSGIVAVQLVVFARGQFELLKRRQI